MGNRHDNDPRALLKARQRALKGYVPGRQKGSGLTKRIRAAVEACVWGLPGHPIDELVSFEAAAAAAGLTARALRAAWKKPAVAAFYRDEYRAMREGQRPANIRALAAIRDDPGLKGSAAGARARVAAAKCSTPIPTRALAPT
jgi:hypothetical protein